MLNILKNNTRLFVDSANKKKKTIKRFKILLFIIFSIVLPFVLLISSSRLRVAAKSCTIASDISSNRLRSTSSGLNLPASSIYNLRKKFDEYFAE